MEERTHHKLARMFKGILDDVKETSSVRGNMKTGTYYVKGHGGYTRKDENPFNGLDEYSSDPNME